MMKIISMLRALRSPSNSDLETIASDLAEQFETADIKEEVVKSIIYSEMPFVVSEYVFEIRDGKPEMAMLFGKERIDEVKNIFMEGLTEKNMSEYLKLTHSADIEIRDRKVLKIHTHPRDLMQDIIDHQKPNFSRKDYRVSRIIPIGLIEYAIKNDLDQGTSFEIYARLTMCYKRKQRILKRFEIALKDDGTYVINDGKTTYSSAIPELAYMTGNVVELLLEKKTEPDIQAYVLHHAVKKI